MEYRDLNVQYIEDWVHLQISTAVALQPTMFMPTYLSIYTKSHLSALGWYPAMPYLIRCLPKSCRCEKMPNLVTTSLKKHFQIASHWIQLYKIAIFPRHFNRWMPTNQTTTHCSYWRNWSLFVQLCKILTSIGVWHKISTNIRHQQVILMCKISANWGTTNFVTF